MKRKTFRIPDDLDEKIQRDVKEKGIASENDYGVKALEHFLTCKKLEQVGGFKLIVAKFAGSCIRSGCNHQRIDVGDICLWGQGVGLICMDCYVTRIGDKALVVKYLKMREYKQTIKALKKEADRLADKVNIYQFYEKVQELSNHSAEVARLTDQYLKKDLATPQEKATLKAIIEAQEKQAKSNANIKRFYEKTQLDKTEEA